MFAIPDWGGAPSGALDFSSVVGGGSVNVAPLAAASAVHNNRIFGGKGGNKKKKKQKHEVTLTPPPSAAARSVTTATTSGASVASAKLGTQQKKQKNGGGAGGVVDNRTSTSTSTSTSNVQADDGGASGVTKKLKKKKNKRAKKKRGPAAAGVDTTPAPPPPSLAAALPAKPAVKKSKLNTIPRTTTEDGGGEGAGGAGETSSSSSSSSRKRRRVEGSGQAQPKPGATSSASVSTPALQDQSSSNKLTKQKKGKGKKKQQQLQQKKAAPAIIPSSSFVKSLPSSGGKQMGSGGPRSAAARRLEGARFRMLNETLYTSTGDSAFERFSADPSLFAVYHSGFNEQVQKWPENPVDKMIKWLKREPSSLVVADLGCGEAALAASVPQKVHSFDLVAPNGHVVACDISDVPLKGGVVDIVVFCLALMGTNYPDFLREAHRIVKLGGRLKIAEITSRIKDIEKFVRLVEGLGFTSTKVDQSNPFFMMLEFKKSAKASGPAPDAASAGRALGPCIYKRR